MSFVNTVDVIGDKALTNSIINGSITEIADNIVTSIGDYAFYECKSLATTDFPSVAQINRYSFRGCEALTTVNFPAVTQIGEYAFNGCFALATADFPVLTKIGTYAFTGCNALKALILRSGTLATLTNTTAFNGTPIADGTGYIYVPSALYDSYRADSKWSTYANQFRKLEDYTVDGTVTGEVDTNRHMVRFFNDDGTFLGYVVVHHGGNATYKGTPVCSEDSSWPFKGFEPVPTNVTADMDCYAQYQEPLTLENASWAQISEISAAGEGANYFSVGDCKTITLNGTISSLNFTNVGVEVYILGFNHNSNIEGTGIHFGTFKKTINNEKIDICLYDDKGTKTDGTKCFNMNHHGAVTYGGWAGCDTRYDILGSTNVEPSVYGKQKTTGCVGYDATDTCATNPVAKTLMSCLPAELRAVMKPITKYTDNVGGENIVESNVTATVDYLPLLSEFEIFGTIEKGNSAEQNYQQQYAYFAAGNKKRKYKILDTSTDAHYYTRSPQTRVHFIAVMPYTYGDAIVFNHTAGDSVGIAPVFMV